MNTKTRIILLLLVLTSPSLYAERKTCMDKEWEFVYGNFGNMPTESKWKTGRTLDLPHDWSVETDAVIHTGSNHIGPFLTTGGDYQNGHLMGGEAWYRKKFRLGLDDKGKRIVLYFEGVYNEATIFVNGKEAYFNHYGYQSFRVDITQYCRGLGKENEVVVKCTNKGKNTRWYSGSGIYRHVWMYSIPGDISLDEWGTQVTSTDLKTTGHVTSAKVLVKTQLNIRKPIKRQDVELILQDATGHEVARSKHTLNNVQAGTEEVSFTANISHSMLWTPDKPSLYHAILKTSGDEITIPFGIRSLEFDPKKGMLLNGEPILLKGGCVHHDHGLLGAASYDGAEIRKVKQMKAMGFNAVRCSHNLPSEHFLDACDSIGLMVIDECFDQWFVEKNKADYHRHFSEHYEADLTTMIVRDRNHPSVVMWSIGNEIPGRQREEARLAARNMRGIINRLDGTRPITAALCEWDSDPYDADKAIFSTIQSLDVSGYNYMWRRYQKDATTYAQPILGTESYPKEASENWVLAEQLPLIIGDFVWTAIDYLGEAGIGHGLFVRDQEQAPFFMPFPYYNGWCGDIDLIGQKKPQSYYRDVIWKNKTISMAMELPCPQGYHREISGWGWQPEVVAWEEPGIFYTPHNLPNIMYNGEGQPIDAPSSLNRRVHVNVYSRAPQVRLYLNNKLIGTKSTGPTFHADFLVDYEPGTLKAVNYIDRREQNSVVLQTTDKPDHFTFTVQEYGTGDEKLTYVTATLVDAKGRPIHDFERQIEWLPGDGCKMLAAGNANPTDMESFRNPMGRLYDGRTMAIIKGKKFSLHLFSEEFGMITVKK